MRILLAVPPIICYSRTMDRHMMQKLKAWKGSNFRKPLLLLGARQVGKTTLLKQFGKEAYQNKVVINFEDRPDYKELFELNLTPERIIRDISLEMGVNITPNETLLIFDEIQECPNALNSLKYFHEKANEYHICGAGSLLGVKLAHTKGFPVGQVNFETLYPLSFMEFLDALDMQRLTEYLTNVSINESISGTIHQKIIQALQSYLLVGGMPEAVDKYRRTESYDATREVHQDIISAYDLDFMKHAPESLIMRITECFHSIPSQLAKENKKFVYSIVRQGARARTHEDALEWLNQAGLISKIFNTNTPKMPLKAYEKRQIFKVYSVDVGLLNTMAGLTHKTILSGNKLFQEFSGSLTENFVLQELKHQHQRLHYWTSDGRAEVDFVLQIDEDIIPLEVKSGVSNRKKSLSFYREKYQPKLAIRTSPQNLDKQDGFINLPLYLTSQLNRLIVELL